MDKIAKWFGLFDIVLIAFYIFTRIMLNLSFETSSLLMSVIVGVTFFVLFLLAFSYVKTVLLNKKAKKKKISYEVTREVYLFGAGVSILIIILAFNSSLYIQALVGNDLFLSLNLDKENFILNNGENLSIVAEFGIVTNPFCSANCNISLKDFSSGEVISFEETPLFVSKSVSKNFQVFINESSYGQKLYRMDLYCNSEKRMFCYTSTNKSKHTSRIISVEHLFNEEQNQSLNDLKNGIIYLNNNYSQLILNLNEINNTISNSSSLNFSVSSAEIESLISRINQDNLSSAMALYSSQNFSELRNLVSDKNSSLKEFNDLFSYINSSVYYEIGLYNSLVDTIYSLRTNVSSLYSSNLDNSSVIILNNFIDNFNSEIVSFSNISNLTTKEKIVGDLILLENNLNLVNSSNESFQSLHQLNEINISSLSLNLSVSNFSLNLSSPSPICCLSNKCEVCLDENYSSQNYPIILLHGHSFNEQISALGSLEAFNSFQDSLESDGYTNAGSLLYLTYDNSSKDILGQINSSVTIKASYYFDVLSTSQGYSLLETKTNNIDTYSIRLKDIIEKVKYITGKDKVIIVAHSMGGLVARRYIQVFGENSVDKLILITVPNHGVDGFVVNYCSLLGTPDECSDMSSSSLFLNKLNRVGNINIPVYNIIGEGCYWENANGDGIVKNESAYLSFAQNYYVNGTCNGFDYFHNTVLDTERYPQAYKIVKEILDS